MSERDLWTSLAKAQDRRLAALSDSTEHAINDDFARAATEALLRTAAAARPDRPGRARRWRLVGVSAAGGAVLALAALWLLVPLLPVAGPAAEMPAVAQLHFQTADGRTGAAGAPLTAQADSELPLRFSDGSLVTFQPGSSGQVDRLTGQGAEVALHRGTLRAVVTHAPDTRWLVHAGPFQVRVTGTRFDVTWAPERQALTVVLSEGSVIVGGALLGAGVPLRAGQRLQVALDAGQVHTDEFQSGGVDTGDVSTDDGRTGAAAQEASTRAPAEARPPAADWRVLAEQGDSRRALQTAEREGLGRLARTLAPGDLLRLGDVARYAGAPAQARRLFEALVERHPGDPLAGDAVFSLGRLEAEAGGPRAAAVWFQRYLRDWPGGPLAAQAAARLAEPPEAAR
jgi:ferric-dicitrate binding protein FerR (iron transport regulator)